MSIEIIEAELCPDHIHMFVRIPTKYSESEVMRYLKGKSSLKSSLMIFDRHSNLKYRYGSRYFWYRGYYVDTVGKNVKGIKEYRNTGIQEYISRQLQEDNVADQINMKEYIDPFTGEPANKGK